MGPRTLSHNPWTRPQLCACRPKAKKGYTETTRPKGENRRQSSRADRISHDAASPPGTPGRRHRSTPECHLRVPECGLNVA